MMDRNLFNSLIKSIKEAGKIERKEIRASRTFTYQDYLDMTIWHDIYMVHHAGFIPLKWYKHWWIHIKLWIAFKYFKIRKVRRNKKKK